MRLASYDALEERDLKLLRGVPDEMCADKYTAST